MASVSKPYRLMNPGRKRKNAGKKRMTLRQKLFFGSARQRSAARASMKGKKSKTRTLIEVHQVQVNWYGRPKC